MSNPPANGEVISGSVLTRKDNSSGSISNGGPEVIAPKVLDLVLFFSYASDNGQEFPLVEEGAYFTFYTNGVVKGLILPRWINTF